MPRRKVERELIREGEFFRVEQGVRSGRPCVFLSCNWDALVPMAAEIVDDFGSQGTQMTLRQLFYQLVAAGHIPNLQAAYKQLGKATSEKRLLGVFPRLIDNVREIHQPGYFVDADDARSYIKRVFRLDRTLGQKVNLYLGMEKAGLIQLMRTWFDDLGLPILPLGGYSSASFIQDVWEHMDGWEDRENVLIYAGDFDPSGEDIDRDFVDRVNLLTGPGLDARFWSDQVVRVALLPEHIAQFNLPPQPGKDTDSRAAAFVERHGALVQVEVDALAPTDLRDLFQAAIDQFWDDDAYQEVLEQEDQERDAL